LAVPIPSLLETPNYSVDLTCTSHAPFPEAICTKCQPSAIILHQQPFRMVDHVEFSSPLLIDEFLSGWRNTGFQRFGWLIGKYDTYTDQVPLGIKAVVEHIYEPSQDGSIDGFQLISADSEDGIDSRHAAIFKDMGLQVVGMIYTDLIDDGTGTGKVVHRRSADTFFVSSSEVLFIAHQQALHPFYYSEKTYAKKKFSSRLSSVIISGEADGGIGLKAYQVSESAVAMEEAHLIAATTDPSQMLVRSVNENESPTDSPLYVPQVFYKFKNEYDLEVQKAANPLFPVEYLLVTLSEGIPLNPDPIFKAPISFPSPQSHPTINTLIEYFGDSLYLNATELASSQLLSNANLLFFLALHGLIANESERSTLCRAIYISDLEILSDFIKHSETWERITSAVSDSVAMKMNASSHVDCWSCKHCTFVNDSLSGNSDCSMCGLPSK
jgi:nuclear protein localization protein 4 homolog